MCIRTQKTIETQADLKEFVDANILRRKELPDGYFPQSDGLIRTLFSSTNIITYSRSGLRYYRNLSLYDYSVGW